MEVEEFLPIDKLTTLHEYNYDNSTQIEIKWPSDKKSLHEVTIKAETFSSYCSDAGTIMSSKIYYPHINVLCDGAVIKDIPLSKIAGITARITFQGHYDYSKNWYKNTEHISIEDDISKGEIIEEVNQTWHKDFYVPDIQKPIVCCPNCTHPIKAEDFTGKKLYTDPQYSTTIDGYKLCPFCEKAKGFFCHYTVAEKPKPPSPCQGCEKAKLDKSIICKKHGKSKSDNNTVKN